MTSGMASGDLAEIELLAEVDDFLADVSAWIDTPHSWPPLSHARNVLRRVLARIERLRTRLDAPLVVATFGGTGTGKSTLVNALVGRDVSPSGRQRPTTTQPVLIVGTAVDLERAGLPLEGVVVQRIDVPELDEIILVDCPDPDTAESEDAGTNLARLRALLPFCDVLFYVSTQQKYRSARVGRELSQAAPGCRLVFVQTHADLDADIRNDWRQQLSSEFAVPEMFFVDSRKAVEERAAGLRPTGEFGRLLDLIVAELATSRRLHVRKANLLDLIGHALRHCRDQLQPQLEPLSKLQHALDEQRQQLIERMAGKLQADLSASRGLWERRLLSAVTAHWGTSPFSAVLKLYNSLGNLIASTTLLRARSSVQLALIGTVQGVRWLSTKQAEQNAQERIDRLGALGLDENLLREAQLVVAGFAREARLETSPLHASRADPLAELRQHAADVESRFLDDAGRRIDEVIATLQRRHSRWPARLFYETAFLTFVVYLLIRIGRNFFYDSVVDARAILSFDFYVAAGIFLALWTGTLVMLFTWRLRGGLDRQIERLAGELARRKLSAGLFPELERAAQDAVAQWQRLAELADRAAILRHAEAPAALGSRR